MNPHYNQQQPYYTYQQHVAGPPQPRWQSPTPQSPSGWNDPRLQNISQHRPQSPYYGQNNFAPISGHSSPFQSAPPPPLPPPPPGVPLPQQSTLRPQENYQRPLTPGYDAAQWAVNYNQGQHNQYHSEPQTAPPQEVRPALPPRPGSSLAHVVHQQQQQHSIPTSYTQTPIQHGPQGFWNVPFNQTQEHNPPTPPPRPAAYATPSQYAPATIPQEQYSHHAPTHHYEPYDQSQSQAQVHPGWYPPPQHQAVAGSTSDWSEPKPATEGPVSPMEDDRRRNSLMRRPVAQHIDIEPPSQNVELPSRLLRPSMTESPEAQVGSTILGGFGTGPSDWQHYNPSGQQAVEEEPVSVAPARNKTEQFTASPLQVASVPRRRSVERVRPPSKTTSPHPQTQPRQQAMGNDPAQYGGLEPQALAQFPSPPSLGPVRQDSRQSNISSASGIARSNTIDNVIQAWYAPLTIDSSVQTSPVPSKNSSIREQKPAAPKIETADHESQTNFKPQVETIIETRIETKQVEVDPYADIQNEYKATLKRFAGMLRQEAVAENDEEKFKIFQGFVIRELRLRSVLYGVEGSAHESTPAVKTELNQEPKDQPKVPNKHANTPPDLSSDQNKATSRPQSPRQQRLPALNTQRPSSPNSREESFVLIDRDGDDANYSPGGRPRISPLRLQIARPVDSAQGSHQPQHPGSPSPNNNQSGQISPSLNAPMTLDDYVMPDQPSPSANAPIVVGSDDIITASVGTQLTGPLNFQPARPLYQPFRYGEGPDTQKLGVRVHGPPVESFAALRQNQAAESGRTLVHDAPAVAVSSAPNRGHSQTPSGGRREHEEAFIGLIRAKSQAIRKKASTTPRPDSPAILRAGTPSTRSTQSPSPSPAPVPPLVKSFQSLSSLIPKSLPSQPGPKSAPHPKLEPLVSSLQKLPSDFTFIHARVLTWDKSNRQLRAKLDTERQARQSDNEEHIDHLFNDNEIGYADIADLEKDFKLEEAGKKYKEDKDELESFTKGVFEFVIDKLEGEIKGLTNLQTITIDLLDLESSSAAKRIQNWSSQPANPSTNPAISTVIQLLLDIHDKVEIRYMKIAEANFERERRRKRLELSVLYTNNDKPGIRKLEAEFTKAERLQIFEESRKTAERANRLLDRFDRAVVRGLAENQGVVDDVLSRLQLLRDLVMGSEVNGPPGQAREELLYGQSGVRDLMDRTSTMIDFILNDSKALVQLLDKADTLSNNADFNMYMSEAKLADASPEKFEQLKSEKVTEDRKVGEELTSRLGGISGVPGEISTLIREVRDKIGGDAGHEERIGKALEAAKRRNTEGLNG